MATTDKSGSIVNLYWVTTDDHDEDWFILARLILRAGTDPIPGPKPRHAQLEDLQMLGFEILNPDPNGRCVRRKGRTFLEGHLESMVAEVRDDAHEAIGQGRPSGTTRRRKN